MQRAPSFFETYSTLIGTPVARLLRDGFALTALGGYRTFSEVAAETLRGLNTTVADEAVVAEALDAAWRRRAPKRLLASHDRGRS